MLIDKFFLSDRTNTLLRKGLDFQADRQLLISSNISNMDTPGYKASEIDFPKQLREAMGEGQGSMQVTDPKHLGASADSISRLRPDVFEEPDVARSNGNNVVVDKEMAKLSETQLMYTAITQILSKRISMMRSAITENSQQS